MISDKAVGVSIGIVKNGRVFYTKGYGTKELGTNKQIDSLTNFHLASISKLFVATAIMQLVEEGKLKLDAKLLDYIPVTNLKDERVKKITIRQMLTHTSGFPDVENYHWNKPKNDSAALGNYAKECIKNKKLLFEPGADVEYSNIAFDILGHLIEVISKKPFDLYEYDKILSKGGMTNSNFDYYKIKPDRRSTPHIKKKETINISKTYPYNREHSPSSTLNSCTYDMCKWITEILTIYNDKNNSYNGVLKRETLLDMWSVKTRLDQSNFLGLGWIGAYSPLGICMMHNGDDIGYSSNLFVYPEQNLGIIVLMNGAYGSGKVIEKLPTEIALLLKGK
jgi:CubicO group peptidase (beta-lactamase class C family)